MPVAARLSFFGLTREGVLPTFSSKRRENFASLATAHKKGKANPRKQTASLKTIDVVNWPPICTSMFVNEDKIKNPRLSQLCFLRWFHPASEQQ
jgi:hypothetical protein